MWKLLENRWNVSGLITVLYLIPVILLSGAATIILPLSQSWTLLAAGLLLSVLGSTALFLSIRSWESQQTWHQHHRSQTHEIPLAASRESELLALVAQKDAALHAIEQTGSQAQEELERTLREFSAYKSSAEQQFEQHQEQLEDYRLTIDEQRGMIVQKQDGIGDLKKKISDLNYEIKTLLQVTELDEEEMEKDEKLLEFPQEQTLENQGVNGDPSPTVPIATEEQGSEQAVVLLKRCIDTAQKLTGNNYFGGGRFKDLSTHNYALDLRRLCDSLGSEGGDAIIVYSRKERKPLFSNPFTEQLLGWNSDKFSQNFLDIVSESQTEWQSSVSQLSTKNLTETRLLMKTKSGRSRLIHCYLGNIPTGIFRNHIIAVLQI